MLNLRSHSNMTLEIAIVEAANSYFISDQSHVHMDAVVNIISFLFSAPESEIETAIRARVDQFMQTLHEKKDDTLDDSLITREEAISRMSLAAFHQFDKNDWMSFPGCVSSNPMIAYDEDICMIVDVNEVDRRPLLFVQGTTEENDGKFAQFFLDGGC